MHSHALQTPSPIFVMSRSAPGSRRESMTDETRIEPVVDYYLYDSLIGSLMIRQAQNGVAAFANASKCARSIILALPAGGWPEQSPVEVPIHIRSFHGGRWRMLRDQQQLPALAPPPG